MFIILFGYLDPKKLGGTPPLCKSLSLTRESQHLLSQTSLQPRQGLVTHVLPSRSHNVTGRYLRNLVW